MEVAIGHSEVLAALTSSDGNGTHLSYASDRWSSLPSIVYTICYEPHGSLVGLVLWSLSFVDEETEAVTCLPEDLSEGAPGPSCCDRCCEQGLSGDAGFVSSSGWDSAGLGG